MISINLTIHNKSYLLEQVLKGIFDNCILPFEFLSHLDDCTDSSEQILYDFLEKNKPKNLIQVKISKSTESLFETKSNNILLKASSGPHCCIIQDDQIITEKGFDKRMLEPFAFDDVFAISARQSHSWKLNPESKEINAPEKNITTWSTLLCHCDHADNRNTPRNIFAIRDSCNRGPLMLNRQDMVKLGFLDEIYAPQEYCEHQAMFQARTQLGKVCGFYDIGWHSKPEYGGTRDQNGNTKQWLFEAHHKNSRIFYDRWKDHFEMKIENRIIK